MAQQVMMPDAKDLISIPAIHMLEGENQFLASCILPYLCAL